MSDNFYNKSNQNFGTESAPNQKVKLRLRLKSGEEFEAEGSLEFVLAQKEDFLNKAGKRTAQYSTQIIPSVQPSQQFQPTVQNQTPATQSHPDETAPSFDDEPEDISATGAPTPEQPPTPIVTSHIITAEERLKDYRLHVPAVRWKKPSTATPQRAGGIPEKPSTAESPWQIDGRIWVKVAYMDGADIILRRKIKSLKPNLAALITLAAAKMLAGVTKMPALELSKSLRLSGYLKGDERLDRILAPEIKAGTLFFEGSKRNREYIISNTGTAKAYTAAEHFLRS